MIERGGSSGGAGSRGVGQRGFSLVEVVVAILVLTIGILGLAASAGQVTKMTGWGQRYGGSAVVAASQLEQLRATPCTSLANGNTTSGRYAVTWTITANGTLRDMVVTVTYNNGRATRTDTFESFRSCV